MDELGPELLLRLLDEHSARLVLFAQQWCRTPEDVVQEAFVRLMRELPPPSDPAAWHYRVVRNGAISASRSSSRRVRHESSAASGREPWFAPSPEDRVDAQSAVDALQSLPIAQRETVVLRLWSNLSFEQIAELTETSASTAHRRYADGLTALRNRLQTPSHRSEGPKR
jgi:RNA polymerase sigma factor (sigma-70 family)